MEKIEVSDPSQFENSLSKAESLAASTGKSLYLLFSGTKNPSTKLSWCPDCVVGEPIIERVLSSLDDGCILLYASVDRDAYRSSSYVYRKSTKIQLKCVPTLIKWSHGKVLARLNDSQCQSEEIVRDLTEM